MRRKVQKKLNFFKYPNCLQANEAHILKGTPLFSEERPIVLELGCGKADFSISLAQRYPDKHFIAIDTKLNRLADGARTAIEKGLSNLLFIQMHIEQILLHFEKQTIDTIWLTFPDPYPKERHEKHRLTHPKFLHYYHHLLKPNGSLLLKTDNQGLFQYTLSVLNHLNWQPSEYTVDLYQSPLLNLENSIHTEYERKFLQEGKKICYLKLQNSPSLFQGVPLEPVPVFSPIKTWEPCEEILHSDFLKPYLPQKDALAFEEYDLNLQFARTQDFKKYLWILVKGEVRVEMVDRQQSNFFKFNQKGQVIQFEVEQQKIYGITVQRSQLIKIPKEKAISSQEG